MEPIPTPPCQCCPQPNLGSSLIVVTHAGSLSQDEIAAIIRNEVATLTGNIEIALNAANRRKEGRLAIDRYDRDMDRWYGNQRRYSRDHAPTFMAALLTHPEPVSAAIEKANELYLALHPKPHQPFPDMEAARREFSNNLRASAPEADIGLEELAAAEAAIEANPERKAFLIRMSRSGSQLREKLAALRAAVPSVKTAGAAAGPPGGDPAAGAVGGSSQPPGDSPGDSPVAEPTPAPPIAGSEGSQESAPVAAPGPQDALPGDADDSSSCSAQ